MRPNKSIRQVGFQETDIVSIVKPITKYAKMITDKNDVRYELECAIHMAKEGRPGPVLLDIPLDIQKQDIEDVSKLLGFEDTVGNVYSEETINKQIDKYIEDLKNSERPCLMIGGGVRSSNAINELLELMVEREGTLEFKIQICYWQ